MSIGSFSLGRLACFSLVSIVMSGCTSVTPAGQATPGSDGPRPGGYTLAWEEETKVDRPVVVYQTTSINPDCSPAGIPEVKVVSGPRHGTVHFKKMSVLPNVTKKSKCYFIRVPGVKGIYTPDKGFVGDDRFTIQSRQIEGGFAYGKVKVTVSR